MSREMLINGRFVPDAEAAVSVVDRGFQFSESVYEVIRVYRGRPFEMERHMRRLRASAAAINLNLGSGIEELGKQALELLKRNGDQDALIYLQITSGAVPRVHLRPAGLDPTIVAIITPVAPTAEPWPVKEMTAITVSDERWSRCYVKTTMLLANTLAKRRAVDEGYDDAIFIRDGFVTEATSANVFAVFDGVLTTPPKSNYLLHGITREVLLEVAEELKIPTSEGPIPARQLYDAEELLLSATAFEVAAVTNLDGRSIGSGRPGPIGEQLLRVFQRRALGE